MNRPSPIDRAQDDVQAWLEISKQPMPIVPAPSDADLQMAFDNAAIDALRALVDATACREIVFKNDRHRNQFLVAWKKANELLHADDLACHELLKTVAEQRCAQAYNSPDQVRP